MSFEESLHSKWRYVWIVAMGVVAALYMLRTNSVFYFDGGDNAYYILLAKSLAQGHGYRDWFLPGNHPHTIFPPVFPLLLSSIIKIRGVDIFAIKLFVSMSAVAALLATVVLLKKKSFAFPVASAIWFGCSYRFFNLADDVLTEPIFIALSFLALIAADKYFEKETPASFIFLIAAAWVAGLTRSAAISLIPAIFIAYLIKNGLSKRGVVKVIALAGIIIIPLLLWNLR